MSTVKQFEKRKRRRIPSNSSVHLALKMPETLAVIFRHLSVADRGRAAQVCKNWKDACDQLSVWRSDKTVTCNLRSDGHVPGDSLQRRGIRNFNICEKDAPTLRSTLTEISRSLPLAQALQFTACEQLSDSILLDTFPSTGLHCITYLGVRDCALLTDASVDLITRLMPNLSVFDLGHCDSITDNALLLISVRLWKLQILAFSKCQKITDTGIKHLAGSVYRNDDEATRLFLQSQQMLDSDMSDGDASGDVSVERLIFRSSSINCINLFGCAQVTDDALRYMSKMPELKLVNLGFCINISEIGLRHLAGKPSSLQELKLTFCVRVNDAGLLAVGQMLGLQKLSLHGCPNITDGGMLALVPLKLTLSHLDVSVCLGLSQQALVIIANELVTLCSLRLDRRNVTSKGLHLASVNLSHLKFIYATGWREDWTRYVLRSKEPPQKIRRSSKTFETFQYF